MTKPIDEFRTELEALKAKGKALRNELIQYRTDLGSMRDSIVSEISKIEKALELLR